ncbi:hypothetical protein [Hymenobacter psychrophilus]|uniref:Uncharacterized protein n=1 Tax=Hymenobacter psychrophilus TaxID=651662 RepID=A0A1H3HYX8_9BACT|nr:hypothetical protein [Hymenobacter psychrophilus]SDY19994.1 hypothetical protein SAMN04488069_106187 [Hymenobacter psychrophilus]
MKLRLLPFLALAATLSLGSCNTETRTDGTAGEAVSDLDSAADDGGVKADAVVIDNDAGPTVTADADSIPAADAEVNR